MTSREQKIREQKRREWLDKFDAMLDEQRANCRSTFERTRFDEEAESRRASFEASLEHSLDHDVVLDKIQRYSLFAAAVCFVIVLALVTLSHYLK